MWVEQRDIIKKVLIKCQIIKFLKVENIIWILTSTTLTRKTLLNVHFNITTPRHYQWGLLIILIGGSAAQSMDFSKFNNNMDTYLAYIINLLAKKTKKHRK